ncbi:His-Xaa-Ser system protein HxsD [Brenneria uluponensis]|uniref:His-Xaa-Ser system protein HxsD n=1 Tax=Brenneria uluponensis TaxID=3057057 RepID=UPI0028EC872B|nr:His-Xaa-Ser system protein HxsD [Brenneria ulupoensis]
MLPIGKGTNALGDYFFVIADKDIYAINAVMKTCYALTDQFYMHVTKATNNQLSIYFYNKNTTASANDIDKAVHDFLDLLHENQMRQIVLDETKIIHAEIVRKAFSPVATLVCDAASDDSLHILTSSV